MRNSSDSKPTPSRPAKNYALWLLGRREWSAKELETRLKLKGYAAEEIAECLEFCQKHKFQSDQKFAESRTRNRASSHGNRRISQELSQKGVSGETIALALADAGDEKARALSAAQRFSGKEQTQALKAKAWRFLAARGFSGDAIKAALQSLNAGAASSAEDFFDTDEDTS
jgi:regulatory protein